MAASTTVRAPQHSVRRRMRRAPRRGGVLPPARRAPSPLRDRPCRRQRLPSLAPPPARGPDLQSSPALPSSAADEHDSMVTRSSV
jgi:hypothetical protein